jgi:hypothetical protein
MPFVVFFWIFTKVGKGIDMGIASSLILLAAGAIMRFAVSVTSTGFNLHAIGIILMIVGAIGFVTSLVFWSSWGGFSGTSSRRQTTASGPAGTTTTTSEEHTV